MDVSLQGFRRLVQTRGLGDALRRCGAELCNVWHVHRVIRQRTRFATVDALLDFSLGPRAASIRPLQLRAEIEPLLRRVESLRPKLILEIGTNNGGTLFLWTRVAAEDAEIISVDLPGGEFGGGYPAWKAPFYRSFALWQQRIHLIRGDSHAAASLDQVREQLHGRALDLLFIDGDHTYEGVKRDYEMYRPLVRPGGLIAFHDIAEHLDQTCQVRTFWLEVERAGNSWELIASPPAGWAGIGVIECR